MTFPQNGKFAEVSTGFIFFIVLVYTLQNLYRKKKKGLDVLMWFRDRGVPETHLTASKQRRMSYK